MPEFWARVLGRRVQRLPDVKPPCKTRRANLLARFFLWVRQAGRPGRQCAFVQKKMFSLVLSPQRVIVLRPRPVCGRSMLTEKRARARRSGKS